VNGPDRASRKGRLAVYGLIAAAGVMDTLEDVFTYRATRGPTASDWDAHLIAMCASAKWGLLAAVALLGLAAIGPRLEPPESDRRPNKTDPLSRSMADRWVPSKDAPRVGIACSGGGIRSASFCLGALHGLGPRRVRGASYLTPTLSTGSRRRRTSSPG
jgi:hypothetical protein